MYREGEMTDSPPEDVNYAVSPAEARAMRAEKDNPKRVADEDYVKAVLRSAEEGDKLLLRDRKTPLTVTGKSESNVSDALNVDLEGKGDSEFYVHVPRDDPRKPTLYYRQPGKNGRAGSYTEKGEVWFAIPEEEYDEDTRYGLYESLYTTSKGHVSPDLVKWYPDMEDEYIMISGYCEDVDREGEFIIPKERLEK